MGGAGKRPSPRRWILLAAVALPVVALATLTRRIGIKLRAGLLLAGKTGKMILGATMLALAILILSGADRSMEAWLVDASPAWLTQLTTRF